jgi:sugar phosphate isomerase/epimerase
MAERVADRAAAMGLAAVSLHAGFIPHTVSDPGFRVVRDRIVELADLFGDRGVKLLLETGQETSGDLMVFLDAVERENVGVNFDPANMLLYGMGDPIESLRVLMPRVEQVHIKDALPSETMGQWGQEVVVGQGAVPWVAFASVLRGGGYAGDLAIEREAGEARVADVRAAAAYLGALL